MMENYDQKAIERKWQKRWQEMNIYHFDFNSDRPVYSIDVPPRYASGPLHAGHAVHYTHIDFTARYKRMRGYNVFFPLCFDVNGIPIEERVERKLNITRKDIDRQEFIKLCSEFAKKNIEKMKEQFIRLGESMDPTIYYQTDAEYYRRLTQISFIELYKKGYIYRGEFPVNWCPRCMTAMADAEINYVTRKTKLNVIKFYFSGKQPEEILKYHAIGKDDRGYFVEIATTRPELLPSCQVVMIHPKDERAPWLVDQTLKVPLFNKEIKIITDESVDPNFGTGVVMVCTFGDKDDLKIALKYKLPIEMCIDEEGRMTEICGKYKGMSIEEARKAIIEDLKKESFLVDQRDIEQNVGVCWRCKTPIEFINAKQWFLKTIPFKKLVLEMSNRIKWYPDFMKKRLEDWVNSLEWDWVISRQRYFATPIPVWECKKCGNIVLAREEDCYVDPTIDDPPVDACPKCGGELKGCEDVFDTWMDSSISPLYNTFWKRDEEKFKKLYPMSLRPQAHDIIRTWAFYTILRCALLTGKEPFKNIMMGGFILSEDGTPMHASLGNVIDPLEIIEEYGADAFRCYAATCSLGEDNPFRKKDVVRGVRLLRKLWNIERFVSLSIGNKKPSKPREFIDIDAWILTRYSKLVKRCTELMDSFNYSQAMKEMEKFVWHEFADHYIEMVKGCVYRGENLESVRFTLYTIGFGIMKLFAPFFPHLTEEVYHQVFKKFEKEESIHISRWPEPILIDEEKEKYGEEVKKFISAVRKWKSDNGIALNAPIKASCTYAPEDVINIFLRSRNIIIDTLNLPREHKFIPGSPEVEERIKDIKLNFAKIGPLLKDKSKEVARWIAEHKSEIIKKIETDGDITWKDIGIADLEGSLIREGYIKVEKEVKIKGEEGNVINLYDAVYLVIET